MTQHTGPRQCLRCGYQADGAVCPECAGVTGPRFAVAERRRDLARCRWFNAGACILVILGSGLCVFGAGHGAGVSGMLPLLALEALRKWPPAFIQSGLGVAALVMMAADALLAYIAVRQAFAWWPGRRQFHAGLGLAAASNALIAIVADSILVPSVVVAAILMASGLWLHHHAARRSLRTKISP